MRNPTAASTRTARSIFVLADELPMRGLRPCG